MNSRDYAYLEPRFAAMAHRGGWTRPSDRARENTVHAFEAALGLGFDYLETDVRTTADGRLVVFHDADLDRVTDATGPLAERTWDELTEVRVNGTDAIPLLEDVVVRFPTARFNIDLKDDRSVAVLAELAGRLGLADRIAVASFSSARIRRFARSAPGIALGASAIGVAWDGFAPFLRRIRIDPAPVLQVPARALRNLVPLVRQDLVRFLHSTDRKLHVWTVDDRDQMEQLLDLGVDGLISNDLVLLKQVLQERGLWRADQ